MCWLRLPSKDQMKESSKWLNLLGNPFPVAITWDNSWIPGNVEGTARVWSGSSYVPVEAGETILAMNGLWFGQY